MNYSNLFEPIKINKMEVKNRIFIPPMGTSACSPTGEVTEMVIKYFENMAKGGAGLIVSEVADVDPRRRYNERVMGIFDDSMVPGWKRMADIVHKYDAKFFAQVIHAGPIPLFSGNELGPVGPSSIPHIYNRNSIPKALTKEEMEEIKQLYVDAARRVQEAGCDGIEVHCGHNHGLLGTFMTPLSNKRTDEYGGDVFGLTRYPIEIIKAIREQVGPDFPIAVRISCTNLEEGGLRIEETCMQAKLFEEASVDFIHASNGSLMNVATNLPPTGTPKALNADYARQIKESVSIPVGAVGRINEPWVAANIIDSGKADVVFMGRALLCDPDLPNKVKNGQLEDIRPCIGCSECVTSAMYGGASNCTLNIELGHELDGEIGKADEKKKVLIVGGGPGGLEAARVAALRGHDVTIMEKSDHLGGQFVLAAYPPTKQELTKGLKYQIREVNKLGVNIELNKTVTKELVEEFGADAVIVATGGKPIMPDWIKNGKHKNVVSAWDALRGVDNLGLNILVIGGGQVGCETADHLAEPHNFMKQFARKITLIEMQDNIMMDDYSANRDLLVTRLLYKNVNIVTSAKVEEILEDGIVYSIDGEKHRLKGVDAIVCAMGTQPENSLVEELSTLSIPVVAVGDAQKSRKIMQAVYEGASAARTL